MERGNMETQAERDKADATVEFYGFAKHNHKFKVGQKVKTRGDIGGFNLVIIKIYNDHYCLVNGYGKDRNMNMAFIEPRNT